MDYFTPDSPVIDWRQKWSWEISDGAVLEVSGVNVPFQHTYDKETKGQGWRAVSTQ